MASKIERAKACMFSARLRTERTLRGVSCLPKRWGIYQPAIRPESIRSAVERHTGGGAEMPVEYFPVISYCLDGIKGPFVLKRDHLAEIATGAKQTLDFWIRVVRKALDIGSGDAFSFRGN